MHDNIKEKIKKLTGSEYEFSELPVELTEKEKAMMLRLQEAYLDMLLVNRRFKCDSELDLPVYMITVFEKIDTLKTPDGVDLGWGDTGAKCTWGFFYDKEKALRALANNATDMNEGCYNYAVLERYSPGIPSDGLGEPAQFFKYDNEKDGYFMIPTPVEFRHICNFAI